MNTGRSEGIGNGIVTNGVNTPSFEELAGQLARNATDIRLIHQPAVREAIRTADLVWGVDRRTEMTGIVWGGRLLDDISSGKCHLPATLMNTAFRLDFESDDLMYLMGACSVIKGVPFEDELRSMGIKDL